MLYKEAVDFVKEYGYAEIEPFTDEKVNELIRLLELGDLNNKKVSELEGKIIQMSRPPRGIVDYDCPSGVCPPR
jgi:hypothetical protein